MMIIRPIEAKDAAVLAELAKITGPGFTSLQDNPTVVTNKLATALAAFAKDNTSNEKLFLFVLEDTSAQKVAGICAIE